MDFSLEFSWVILDYCLAFLDCLGLFESFNRFIGIFVKTGDAIRFQFGSSPIGGSPDRVSPNGGGPAVISSS